MSPTCKQRHLVAVLFLCCLISTSAAESPRPLTDLPELADRPARWAEIMDLFDVPGMAVAVVREGQTYVQCFGSRNPTTGEPVTPETEFYIASITKTFTATAICELADEGRLALDDPVRKYLPRFQLADSSLTQRITIRDLLCHRYGIDSQPIVLLDAFSGEISEDRYYHWLQQAEIKGSVAYSNVHFTILGRVIESVTGQPWRDFIKKKVLDPAAMHRTTGYASAMYKDKNHAVPFERNGSAWEAVAQVKTDATMHAAGGMGTTALDGARWMQLHLNNGTLGSKRVLRAETAQAMRNLESKLDKPDGSIRIIEGFGLAWFVGTFNGHRLCQHGGGYQGASSYMAMLPDDHVAVVVLLNASGIAQGLGDIVAVETMERLTGTKSPWDVYERFTARARQFKEKQSQPKPDSAQGQAPAVPEPVDLTRYSGTFSNAWWGTLRVESNAGAAAMHLGTMGLEFQSVPGDADRFEIPDLLDEKTLGRFVLDDHGKVQSVALQHPKYGEIVFSRR